MFTSNNKKVFFKEEEQKVFTNFIKEILLNLSLIIYANKQGEC